MEFYVKEDFDCQLLYFTSSGCLKDNKGLVFIGEKDGNPNVYWKNFATGKVTQLTQNREGILKSYVYFNATPYRGLGKASVCLDSQRELIYYIQGNDICQVDLQGNIRVLAQIPDGQVTAFMHVSADGSRLCVPTTDFRALEDDFYDAPATREPHYNIDERVQKEKLNSYLRVFDTASGEQVLCEQVPMAWITHVQFHPKDNDMIMYNHEWSSQCGVRRMWLWDGKCHRALRTIDKGRNINDLVTHEMWGADGSEIIYHGGYAGDKEYFVGHIDVATGRISEIALHPDYRCYGHFVLAENGLLVSDGYYMPERQPGEKLPDVWTGAAWISVQRVDWEKGTITWFPIEKHDSSWIDQDAHPHPIFSSDEKRIFYTTDNGGGRREIRSCLIPEEAL